MNKYSLDNIERFLKNELTSTEEVQFRQQLESDSEFATEVEKTKLIIGGTRVLAMQQEIGQIQNLFLKQELKRQQNRQRWIGLIILLVLVLMTMLSYFWLRSTPTSPEIIYASYFKTYPLESNLGSAENLILKQAYNYYQSDEPQKAIPLFEEYLKIHHQLDKNTIYLGVSYMKIEQYQQAITTFYPLIEEATIFANTARWYSALSQLQLQNVEQAIRLCEEIKKTAYPASSYHNFAADLQSKLTVLTR